MFIYASSTSIYQADNHLKLTVYTWGFPCLDYSPDVPVSLWFEVRCVVGCDICLCSYYLFIYLFISCTGVCVGSLFLLLLVRSFLTPWVLMAQIHDTQSRSQSSIRTSIRQITSTSQILRSSSTSDSPSFWGCCSCDLMYTFLLRQIYLLVLFLWYQIHFSLYSWCIFFWFRFRFPVLICMVWTGCTHGLCYYLFVFHYVAFHLLTYRIIIFQRILWHFYFLFWLSVRTCGVYVPAYVRRRSASVPPGRGRYRLGGLSSYLKVWFN